MQQDNYFRGISTESWYALHTRRHHENVIARMLGVNEIETYLPMLEVRRYWTHRTKVLNVPLFPNYVFARFNINKRVDIISIRGVIRIVGTHCGPSPIPEDQIKTIRIIVESKFKKVPYPFLVKGRHVRVKRGILKGQEGVLLRKSNVYRFVVCLPILGQSIGVETDASALETIS